jgi:hypothetical protein
MVWNNEQPVSLSLFSFPAASKSNMSKGHISRIRNSQAPPWMYQLNYDGFLAVEVAAQPSMMHFVDNLPRAPRRNVQFSF